MLLHWQALLTPLLQLQQPVDLEGDLPGPGPSGLDGLPVQPYFLQHEVLLLQQQFVVEQALAQGPQLLNLVLAQLKVASEDVGLLLEHQPHFAGIHQLVIEC